MRISLFTYFVSFYSLAEHVETDIAQPAGLFELEEREPGYLLTLEEVTISLLHPRPRLGWAEHFNLTAITARAGKGL